MADGSSVAILERLSSERSVKQKIFFNIRNNFPILKMGASGIPGTPGNPGWTRIQPGFSDGVRISSPAGRLFASCVSNPIDGLSRKIKADQQERI